MKFFVGLHQPADAGKMRNPCMISVNRLWDRVSDFAVGPWLMDSGAFSELAIHGRYRPERSVAAYARQIRRWSQCGNLLAAVAQDYMCEPFMIEKTGLSVAEHQRLTVERYDALTACDTNGVYVMPVLQGYSPGDYAGHIERYGDRLKQGMWVGVGSVCKRNASPSSVAVVLEAIKSRRPDLRLHGFGLKLTALQIAGVRDLLYSADSMAWSFAARMRGGGGNDWREAVRFSRRVDEMPVQMGLW